MKSKGTIIIDIDGTLADISHRVHHLLKTPKDWDAFYADNLSDKPNHWCIEIMRSMDKKYHIILCTGRMERHMKETKEWLTRHKIPWDTMLCRKEDDHRGDDVVKAELYNENVINGHFPKPVLFVIDDRKRVVEMWRKQGLVCLQCAEGNF
jgi:hypothetical protein